MNNLSEEIANIVAVLPAAGIGSRMKIEHPKQYLKIGGRSILEHSVQALLRHPRIIRVIVVIRPQDRYFYQLPIAADPQIQVVHGGAQRADSVMAGLRDIRDVEWVLVHDAVRPCLQQSDLRRLLQLTQSSDVGGILAAPVRDTMKRGDMNTSRIAHTIERDHLWHALTPQLFPIVLLRDCLQRALAEDACLTDEASALEYCGYHPTLVMGRSDNIKVTRPEDLALAEFYLTRQCCEESG